MCALELRTSTGLQEETSEDAWGRISLGSTSGRAILDKLLDLDVAITDLLHFNVTSTYALNLNETDLWQFKLLVSHVRQSRLTHAGLSGLSNSPAVSGLSHHPSERLQLLYRRTGLTWLQLARLFGVSRRSVHSWVGGQRMAASNLERLVHIEQVFSQYEFEDTDVVRSALFSSRAGALSPYAQLLEEMESRTPRSEARAWVDRNAERG